jgi:hypothetical protein
MPAPKLSAAATSGSCAYFSGPASGAAPMRPSVRRFSGRCQNRRRHRNYSAATAGSNCARRQALLASNDLRIGRLGRGHANRRSPQCVPMGLEHHDDQRCRVIHFDRLACEEFLARTNWDDGIRSYIGGAQEAVPGSRQAGKPACVRCEVWRQLKKNRPRLVIEKGKALVEELQAVDRVLRQALPVADELRRLP